MIAIIIPAYRPDHRLLDTVRALKKSGLPLVVIDDGGGPEFTPLFRTLEDEGTDVVIHPVNAGKGAAIKTGIAFARQKLKGIGGFVTCDADGQHRPEDVLRIAAALDADPEALILGARDFSGADVPRKSRFGNAFSSFYFRMATGVVCHDTQTGLRGIPGSLAELALAIPENRYDYEMNFLMRAAQAGRKIQTVPIATVYLDGNASSHFRPVLDSLRIYREPLKFALASLASAIVDLLLFHLLSPLLAGHVFAAVLVATVAARIGSGILNFTLNRIWSFRNYSSLLAQFRRYFTLYLMQLGASITFVWLFSFLPISLTVVKAIVDFLLFVVSFFVQKRWVFARRHRNANLPKRPEE